MHRPTTLRVTSHSIRTQRFRVRASVFRNAIIGTVTLCFGVFGVLVFQEHHADAGMDVAYTPFAQENSQTLGLLRAARNIDPVGSQGGGDIRTVDSSALVADGAFSDVVADDPTADRGRISFYVVQEGDTLSQIADMFDVSVNTIMWGNQLRSGKDIQPGQTLLILPIDGVQHRVVRGDTVAKIARRYGGDIKEIIAYNNLIDESAITVGMTITVPGGEVPREEPVLTKKKNVAKGRSGKNTDGYFIHPVLSSVRTQGLHGYNAIDFGAPAGTPIRAAANGTVMLVRNDGWNGGYGTYVVIDHPNGTQTLYSHLSRVDVASGQMVKQGETVGRVGSTGRSTGNHLHFEVRGGTNPF